MHGADNSSYFEVSLMIGCIVVMVNVTTILLMSHNETIARCIGLKVYYTYDGPSRDKLNYKVTMF